MTKNKNDKRLEYEAPMAEIIRLGTEDILSTSSGSTPKGTYEHDDFGLF